MRQPTTTLDPRADRIQRIALIAGVVALALTALGAFLDATMFFQAYLMAFLYWLALPLGCMALAALYHLAGGVWGLPIRRPLEAAMITIPLFKEHKVLSQVAGHGNHTIKLLPPLTIGDEDVAWIERSFDAVIADAHRVPGAVWSLGKTLADHAIKAKMGG